MVRPLQVDCTERLRAYGKVVCYSLSDINVMLCKKRIVISSSHLLSEFQVSKHITCMDS